MTRTEKAPAGRVTLAAARVTLKQHRFEVAAAALAALVLGVWGLTVEVRLEALAVSPGGLANEATRIVGAMAYLPFAVGLLGGVPIVARELESRTAQTAWSLNASRVRWLVRQVAPIVLLLGVSITFAAVVASLVQADREAWGESAFFNLERHGPLVIARAFGAFGVGLLVGAMLGRTLPAFVFGVAFSLALGFAVGSARDAWLASLEPVVIGDTATGVSPIGVATDVAWRTPEGMVISREQARAIVSAAGVPEPAADDVQDVPAVVWLEEHGYAELTLGVTEAMAVGWAPYDALIFGLVGVVSVAGTIPLVNRRRPT